MFALVYHGPGAKSWDEVPKPTLIDDTDAIVRVDTTTICGSDLHICAATFPKSRRGAFAFALVRGPRRSRTPRVAGRSTP